MGAFAQNGGPIGWSIQTASTRGKLFANLTNFITCGNPLGSLGAIWARIAAFEKGVGAKGVARDHAVFDNTRWINTVSGTDPVSGLLEVTGNICPPNTKETCLKR